MERADNGGAPKSRGTGVRRTVDVDGGQVRGIFDDDVWTFAGVPYAQAPLAALRWRPPERPSPWRGVRNAETQGPIAPQIPAAAGMGIPGDPSQQSEDCLHLTVRTPALDRRRRPVMVWIHGGGFTSGTSGSVLYDGSDVVRRHDVVLVAVNYRLGALGFLAHPSLRARPGAPFANWGLLDQIAALRWVRDHVGAFGGDPSNVTVFGESAGAMSICALLAMPEARGLFHRAIVQSGPPYVFTAARAVEVAEDVGRGLSIRTMDRGALEAVPAAALVEVVAEMQRRPPRPGELPLPLLPTVDGVSLPRHPLSAVAAGDGARVPMIVGTNRDELAFFALMEPKPPQWDETHLLARLRRSAPAARAEDIAAAYRRARARRGEPVTARRLWTAAGSDLVFRWPSLRLANAHALRQPSTFVYLFTWETPFLGGTLGACHALEIPFVFGTVRHPLIGAFSGAGPAAEALSQTMQAAWVSLARHGDPSADGVPWPAWEPSRRLTMVWGPRSGVEEAPLNEELGAWADVLPLEVESSPTGVAGAVEERRALG